MYRPQRNYRKETPTGNPFEREQDNYRRWPARSTRLTCRPFSPKRITGSRRSDVKKLTTPSYHHRTSLTFSPPFPFQHLSNLATPRSTNSLPRNSRRPISPAGVPRALLRQHLAVADVLDLLTAARFRRVLGTLGDGARAGDRLRRGFTATAVKGFDGGAHFLRDGMERAGWNRMGWDGMG